MPISNVLLPVTIHVITPVFINQMPKVYNNPVEHLLKLNLTAIKINGFPQV
jgi:hypothetical protein